MLWDVETVRRETTRSFSQIPCVTKFKHREDLNQLSVKRRQAALAAVKRQDFSELKLKNARIY